MWKPRIEVLIMFLKILRKKAFAAGRIVHGNLLRLNLEKRRFFKYIIIIIIIIRIYAIFYWKSLLKREEKRGVRTTYSVSKGKYCTELIVYFVLGQTDPQTPRAPAWRLVPAVVETAVEGRNKTLYCLAVGRLALNITSDKQFWYWILFIN